jgi:hypothetical protein
MLGIRDIQIDLYILKMTMKYGILLKDIASIHAKMNNVGYPHYLKKMN